MPRITVTEAQGWADKTKLTLATLDLFLLDSIETETLARLNTIYDTDTWTDPTSTPPLIRVIICKLYVSWVYDRAYSENQDEGNDYAALLRSNAEMLISGLLDGTIEVPGVTPETVQGPSFYPNDVSSAQEPTPDDLSLGPAKFSMGRAF